ncbi:hypothetical protein CEP52_006318 [Fusarium oligoseptatum]|uniref:Chromo domain-containing protein n=1 Tax=Fusarium oligoseptatum TaxID=2604345 RepID=A0A428TTE3_9HYPO|nr:hypothetical protein CEP52_006318 [Fusarium oligoseptatum]
MESSESVDSEKRERSDNARTRIEVQIPQKRTKGYVPGSGPPLQPISLLPPRDSTAYILDRIILPSPGPAADGKPLPRRMTYIVGWSDLPAARMLVPAMKILDYVSPQEVEEWGFKNMEEQMDSKKLAQEKKEQAGDMSSKPKRRGRPPKHSKIETAVVTEPESKTAAIPKKGVMTISAPKENRLEDFEGLSDEYGTPSRQLQQETSRGSTDVDMDHDRESDLVPQKPENQSSNQISRARRRWNQQVLPRPKKPPPVAQSRDELFSGPEWTWAPLEEHAAPLSVTNAVAPRLEPQLARRPPIPEVKSLKSKPKEKKATPKPPEPAPAAKEPAGDNDDWEVKRLEGMEFFEVEGVGVVRYFKVRWEGDWPPDQNPSWEPEDNLPATLVRNYLKQGKKRRAGHDAHEPKKKAPRPTTTQTPSAAPKKKGHLKQTTLPWGIPAKQYKSVSEAFEGDEEEIMGMPVADDGPDEVEEEQDELFVVEEPPTKKSRVWHGHGTSGRMDLPVYR